MALNARHPLYTEFVEDWQQMRDTYAGERAIKSAGLKYLPATSGMIADGMEPMQPGWRMYDAYRKRSRFPDLVAKAIAKLLGVMHLKPPVIELPPQLESLRERATIDGESLEVLLGRINEEQLITGRVGLLADIVDGVGEPYLALYRGESIINWDDGTRANEPQTLNLVVLDESEYERQAKSLDWEWIEKYRVLVLGQLDENEREGNASYRVGTFRESVELNESSLTVPNVRGRSLDAIPFVFVNSKDIVPKPDTPPMLGLSNLSLTIYRGEADYRQSLFMQGQDTLVIIGASADSKETRVGSGATINLPTNGDAKYIGVDSNGLEGQREALRDDYRRAEMEGGELVEVTGRSQESGEALRVRVAARTATLKRVALAGAYGLQSILRLAARWVGANEDAVIVQPNLDFVDDRMAGKEVIELVTAKNIGAPISMQSIHAQMQDRGLTELSLEEELEVMRQEKEAMADLMPSGATDEGSPEEDDEEDPEEDDQAA